MNYFYSEIFFAHTELWYYSNYSTSFNHRPQSLFDELRDEIFVDFAIDYALDKLCWIALNYENSTLSEYLLFELIYKKLEKKMIYIYF